MITVSLCMIVKNEEKVLARCLDSLADMMDEIIIVDTGSTDRTRQIAARYTHKVYDFQWVNDFAAARNYAGSLATMEYIYTADADEVLDEVNRRRFLELKEALLPEIEIVQMKYCTPPDQLIAGNFQQEYRPKLYRRQREFTWIDPIHETLRLDPLVYDSEIEIQHLPEGNHAGRDLERLSQLSREGVRLSQKLHHMYAMELFRAGEEKDFREAEEAFLATMEQEGRSMDEVKEAVCVLARLYRLQGNVGGLMTYALKDAVTGSTAEVCCELGFYYEGQGDWAEAATWYRNAASETESILDIRTSQNIPAERLAVCYEKLGMREEAQAWRKRMRVF